jgi:hypothetical protein
MSAHERPRMSADGLRVAVIGDSTAYTDASGPAPRTIRCCGRTCRRGPARSDRTAGRRDGVGPARDRCAGRMAGAHQGPPRHVRRRRSVRRRHPRHRQLRPRPCRAAPGARRPAPPRPPGGLRSRLRSAVRRIHPWVVRLRGARGVRTSPAEFARRYGRVLDQAKGLTMDRAVTVALGPTSHGRGITGVGIRDGRSPSVGSSTLARQHGWRTVPVWEHVEPHAARLNPDGVHWPAPVHRAVGRRSRPRCSRARLGDAMPRRATRSALRGDDRPDAVHVRVDAAEEVPDLREVVPGDVLRDVVLAADPADQRRLARTCPGAGASSVPSSSVMTTLWGICGSRFSNTKEMVSVEPGTTSQRSVGTQEPSSAMKQYSSEFSAAMTGRPRGSG